MSIWTIVRVEHSSDVTLESWAVFEVPLRGFKQPWTCHLAGFSCEHGRGHVSSPIESFDPLTGQCVTGCHRVYRLRGLPGLSEHTAYVWRRWKRIAYITEQREVTKEVLAELQAAQAGGDGGVAA